jgi:uncharacterized membrane protein
MPSEVVWSYCVGGVVLVIGLVVVARRGDWPKARGLDKLILLGPVFYAAPIAAFGTEHFTMTPTIVSQIPDWIPWHRFWAYFVGACFIAAGASLATAIRRRLAASLLALTFFCFVLLMDLPGWLQDPHDRFGLAFVLRELAFSGGALGLAVTSSEQSFERSRHALATVARSFVGMSVLFYSIEQFLHPDHVPGLPLEAVTPTWIYGHAIWTYVVAVVYAIAGPMLLLGKKTRAAAGWIGLSIFLVELVVYVPFAVADHASLEGLNYAFDTLMYCGAVLLLADAMPRETLRRTSIGAMSQETHQPQAVG